MCTTRFPAQQKHWLDQWFLTLPPNNSLINQLVHKCVSLTSAALVTGERFDRFINIIQYGFGFVSSCFELCCQKDFLSFLLLPL